MALNAPVGLSGEDQKKTHFSLNANATNLNRHGAAVQVPCELLLGTTVELRNKRGMKISARVVTQVSAVQGKNTYGVEFVEDTDQARNFWGINFPSNG